MPSSPPRVTYSRLLALLEDMRAADSLDVLATAWESFLIYHQRTWNRCEAHYRDQSFWPRLRSRYAHIRKVDPLFQYVHQARHADEHGIGPVAEIRASCTVVSGGTLLPGSVITGSGDSVVAPGSTAKVVFHPASVVANAVVNQGRTYHPPALDGQDRPPVLLLAERTVEFFTRLFADIDAAGGD